MRGLFEKIASFATRITVGTVVGTAIGVLVGTAITYYVVFGTREKKTCTVEIITASKETSRDIHTQNKLAATHDDEMHSESENALEVNNNKELKDLVKPESCLAQYEATLATVVRDASGYKPAPVENNLKENEITTAHIEKKVAPVTGIASDTDSDSDTVKAKAPESVLTAFEATTAMTTLEAQNHVAAMPKPPKPFLAAYEATTAMTTLEAQNHVAAMPKAPKPFLAAYEATTAMNILEAQNHVAAMPKAPKPSLAAYEATTAMTILEAQTHVAAMPKAPKPSLAAYETTTAMATLEAQNYVAAIPKAPKPSLADYEATVARCAESAQKHVASLVLTEDYVASLKAYQEKQIASRSQALEKEPISLNSTSTCDNITTASAISTSRAFIHDSASFGSNLNPMESTTSNHQSVETNKGLSNITTNSTVFLEAPSKHQFVHEEPEPEPEAEAEAEAEPEFDSDIEVEIEENMLSSPSAISSVSSIASSETGASRGMHKTKGLQINTAESNTSQFMVSWDQMYAGSNNNNNNNIKSVAVDSPISAAPFMSTADCIYYPNCTNKKCKFVHPGLDNNPKAKRAVTVDGVSKKPLTMEERIQQQSQRHFPAWKSRCFHWPFCTNNHCKYSHPTRECRMGDQCTFMNVCMFLHPSDFVASAKKQLTPKRAQMQSELQSLI